MNGLMTLKRILHGAYFFGNIVIHQTRVYVVRFEEELNKNEGVGPPNLTKGDYGLIISQTRFYLLKR